MSGLYPIGVLPVGVGDEFEFEAPAYITDSDTLAFAGQSVTAVAGRASGSDAVAVALASAGTVAGRMAGANVVALTLDANEISSLQLALPGTVSLLNTGATASASTMQTVAGLSNNGGGAVLKDIARAA